MKREEKQILFHSENQNNILYQKQDIDLIHHIYNKTHFSLYCPKFLFNSLSLNIDELCFFISGYENAFSSIEVDVKEGKQII